MTREEICESLKTIITQIDETIGNKIEGVNATYISDIKPNSLRFVLEEAFKALKQEPKKAHWINGDYKCPCCGKSKFENLDGDIYADWQPNYCPNCGARME